MPEGSRPSGSRPARAPRLQPAADLARPGRPGDAADGGDRRHPRRPGVAGEARRVARPRGQRDGAGRAHDRRPRRGVPPPRREHRPARSRASSRAASSIRTTSGRSVSTRSACCARIPSLSWVSYGDRADRFVGAWNDGSDQLYLNRSFPRGGRIRLEEDRILPDGRRERVRESDDHRYRPHEQAFFRLAAARRGVAWTEPYRFYDGGLGVTCAVPLLDAAGAVRGVFTVDLSLDGLSRFVGELHVSPRGRVFIATGRRASSSRLRAASTRPAGRRSEDAALVGEVVKELRASVDGRLRVRARRRALPRPGGRLSDRRPPVDDGGRGARARLHGGHRGADVAGRGARGSWRWSSPRPGASCWCGGSRSRSASSARRRAGSARATSTWPSCRGAATRSARWPGPWPRWCRGSAIATSSGTCWGATSAPSWRSSACGTAAPSGSAARSARCPS